jgi:hypothetical protein
MLLSLVLGTGSILVTQLLLAVALAGVGLAARRAFGLRTVRLDDCFLAFWVGLGCVTFLLILWNFFFAVSGLALVLLLAGGLLGWLGVRPGLAGMFGRDAWRPTPVSGLLLVLAALWVADLSLGPLSNWDSALYHMQVVKWAEAYPAVPGIGNLNGPLAFNNSFLLFDALLSAGPWQGRSNHLGNGLLVLMCLWQSIVAGSRLAAGERRPALLFQFLLIAPAANAALDGGVSSFATDIAPTLMVMVVAARLFALLTEPVEGAERSYALVALAVLLSTAVTFKANIAVFAFAAFVLAVITLRARPGTGESFRPVLRALGVAVAFALVWMGRGVVLSGYPVFPTSVAGFPVEWRVPEEHAAAELALLVHSGRGSTWHLPVVAGEVGFEGWFPVWIRNLFRDPIRIVVPLALSFPGVAAYLLARRRSSRREQSLADPAWWIALPLVLAVLAWFLSAPSALYAVPFFWSLAALIWSQAYRRRLAGVPTPSTRVPVALGVLLGLSTLVISPMFLAIRRGERPFAAIVKANLNRPGTDLWFQPIEGKPELSPYRTRSGLLLNTVPNRCWDAPLPCTPVPAANLRLRDPSSMAKGFVVDGSWAMENWPLNTQPDFLTAWRRSRTASSR